MNFNVVSLSTKMKAVAALAVATGTVIKESAPLLSWFNPSLIERAQKDYANAEGLLIKAIEAEQAVEKAQAAFAQATQKNSSISPNKTAQAAAGKKIKNAFTALGAAQAKATEAASKAAAAAEKAAKTANEMKSARNAANAAEQKMAQAQAQRKINLEAAAAGQAAAAASRLARTPSLPGSSNTKANAAANAATAAAAKAATAAAAAAPNAKGKQPLRNALNEVGAATGNAFNAARGVVLERINGTRVKLGGLLATLGTGSLAIPQIAAILQLLMLFIVALIGLQAVAGRVRGGGKISSGAVDQQLAKLRAELRDHHKKNFKENKASLENYDKGRITEQAYTKIVEMRNALRTKRNASLNQQIDELRVQLGEVVVTEERLQIAQGQGFGSTFKEIGLSVAGQIPSLLGGVQTAAEAAAKLQKTQIEAEAAALKAQHNQALAEIALQTARNAAAAAAAQRKMNFNAAQATAAAAARRRAAAEAAAAAQAVVAGLGGAIKAVGELAGAAANATVTVVGAANRAGGAIQQRQNRLQAASNARRNANTASALLALTR
jgi:hypothetical protein